MTLEIDIFEVYSKAKKLLLHPNNFFNEAKKEKGKKDAFTFFAVVSLVGNILGVVSILFLLPFISQAFPQLGIEYSATSNVAQRLLTLTIAYFSGLVATFISAGLLTLFLKLFTRKARYNKTFRIYTYSWAPFLLVGWVPQISFYAVLYSLFLLALGIKVAHKFSPLKTVIFIASLTLTTLLLNDLLSSVVINTTPQ